MLGRKPIYMGGLILHILITVVLIVSKNVILDYFALFILGYSVTMRLYIGYAYNVEMQPKSHKIFASTVQFLFESFAYLCICIYFMYISKDWRPLQSLNLLFSIFGLICLSRMPDTPSFLLSQKRFPEAQKAFSYIAKMNGKSTDIPENFKFIVSEAEVNSDP